MIGRTVHPVSGACSASIFTEHRRDKRHASRYADVFAHAHWLARAFWKRDKTINLPAKFQKWICKWQTSWHLWLLSQLNLPVEFGNTLSLIFYSNSCWLSHEYLVTYNKMVEAINHVNILPWIRSGIYIITLIIIKHCTVITATMPSIAMPHSPIVTRQLACWCTGEVWTPSVWTILIKFWQSKLFIYSMRAHMPRMPNGTTHRSHGALDHPIKSQSMRDSISRSSIFIAWNRTSICCVDIQVRQ